MPLITEYLPQKLAWILLLLAVMINGIGNSFVQGGMFGFASTFPPKYMIAMMTGQGINGLILNSVKMLLLAILPPDEDKGAEDQNSFYDSLIFLGVFSVILMVSVFCYFSLLNMEFCKHYLMKADFNDSSVKKSMVEIQSLAVTDNKVADIYLSTVSYLILFIILFDIANRTSTKIPIFHIHASRFNNLRGRKITLDLKRVHGCLFTKSVFIWLFKHRLCSL